MELLHQHHEWKSTENGNIPITYYNESIYSQTCIKRPPLGQIKSGLLRQMTS